MNLLLITQDFPPNIGGIETYSHELARRFHVMADSFGLLAPAHPESATIDEMLPYPTFRIKVQESLLPLALPFTLQNFIDAHNFDTVLHAQWQTVAASLLSRKKSGYPRHIYVSAHARELLVKPFAGNTGWISRKLNAYRRRMFKKIDGFFPVSEYTAKLLWKEGIPGNKIHIVGNGTDPDFFTPRPTQDLRNQLALGNKKVLFSVCRLVPRKGLDLVLHALDEIVGKNKDIVYLIGGDGEDRSRLQRITSDLGLNDYVHFLGRIPEQRLPAYYSLADVFVMPARNSPPDVEGFGIVFLEANACETPVIGSRTGGISDAIVDGETGLMVKEGDKSELASALNELLNNEVKASEMGRKGRLRVVNHANWDHVAKTLYEKMELINRN